MHAGYKMEKTQIQKVQKKPQLEQELRTLEDRSRAQGGRTLQQLEKAEKWRKEHEEQERAAVMIQKVVRGHLARAALDEQLLKEVEEKERAKQQEEAERLAAIQKKEDEEREAQ